MPIYTYQCSNCGVRFDKEQSFSERNPVRCPECRKKSLHRVYRPVGVIFKGSGFYSTDNRSSKHTTTKSASSDTKDKTTSKDESEDKKSTTAKSEKKSTTTD